jgi:hypothetical protein
MIIDLGCLGLKCWREILNQGKKSLEKLKYTRALQPVGVLFA